MVGNEGETTMRYASAGIAATGTYSLQNSNPAIPPKPTKIGAP